MRKMLPSLGWAMGMLVLILDGRTALSGGMEGITLCLQTLIPSLFPLFVLSAMLTSSLPGNPFLLTGILGGYPIGAGNTAQAYRAGQLSRQEAERLVVLSNCPGPSFIFGVLTPVLGDLRMGICLWGVYLLSVLALWMIFPKRKPTRTIPRPMGIQNALGCALHAMAGVCGWVILFRVVLAILNRWVLWLLPDWGQAVVYGILELSNGCLALGNLSPQLRFLLAAGFLGFGGICVMLQTAGVAEGISMRLYFPGKLFQSLVCMTLASCLYPGTIPLPLTAGFGAAGAVLGYILQKIEKRSGNPTAVGV